MLKKTKTITYNKTRVKTENITKKTGIQIIKHAVPLSR